MPVSLTPEEKEKLKKGLTQYAATGASDDDLRKFRDAFISGLKKKGATTQDSGQPAPQPGRPSAPSFGQKITEKIAGSATQIPLKTTLQKEQEESKMAGEIVSGFVKGVKQKEEERKQAYEQGGVAYEEFKQKQAAETSRIAKAKEEESKNKKASEFKGYVREKDVFQMPTPGESQNYSYDFTKTYIDYLSQSDPDRADFVRDKYFTLKAKDKAERDSEDEKFLRQIESEALDITYRAKSQELDLTIAAIDKLQKKATPADKGALDYLYKKYESTKNSLKGITAAYDQNKLQYGKIAGSELQAEEEKLARFKELQEGGAVPVATEFFKGIGNAVTNGVINLYQIPKVMGDLVGDTDYDWADQMYDSVSGAKRELDKDFGTPLPQGMKMSDLPTTARLAVVGGNAIGSVGLFAAGGAIGGTTRLGQAAATFGTSFLTTESDYYQEALDAGMSAQDAAFSATYLAAQTALVESIIPDVKYFQPSAFRKSVIQGLSSGVRAGLPIKEAAKMAFKNTMQAIPQSAGSLAKAGTKEAGEEILGQAAEDVGKEVINASAQKEYFNDTFDPEAYTDAILGGFIAGGGLSVFSRPNSKSPTQQEVMREIVDRRDLLTRPGTASDKIAGKEDLRDFNDATEIFDAMSSHSAWKDMPREKQNQAFALAQQTAIMKKEQERMKKLRIPDEQKDAEIKRLEDEVNMMFAEQLEQQKQRVYDQENIQGIPSEVGVGEEPVQAEPVEVPSTEAPEAGGVLQAPEEEVTPTTKAAPVSDKKAEYRREDFPEEQMRVDTPVTQKLVNYLADVLEVPRINIADGKYVSWIKEQIRDFKDTPGGENLLGLDLSLNAPKQVFDRITKFAELAASEAQPTTEAAPEVELKPSENLPTVTITDEVVEEKPTTVSKPSRRERLAKMFEEPKVEVAPEVTVEAAPETTPKPSETVTRISEVAPAPRRVGAVEASEGSNENAGDESALEGVGMDNASLNEWKKKNRISNKKGRIEELAQAVRELMSGKIKFKEYYEKAKKAMPSKLMDKVPTPATNEEIVGSVDRNKIGIGIINLNKFVKKGMKVGLRIDIPAFYNFGKHVVTIHDRSGSGQPVIGYGSTGSINNVTFRTSVSTAAKIAAGESKSPFAMAQGEWMDESPESIQKRAEEALNSPEWIQVGMNPTRNSFFFDKADGNPVVSADEVLQVGNLVLAKNAKKIDLNTTEGMAEFEKMFSAKSAEGVTYQFREGRRTRLAKMFETSDGKIAAEKVANFLREANIDVEILDPNSFERKGQQRNFEGDSDGVFLVDNNTGKIYLNSKAISSADGKIIAFHEGIHPVINIIRNTNPELYKAIVDGLKAEASKNEGVAQAAAEVEADEYYQQQGPLAVEDETVVETMARVAAGDINIDTFSPTLREKLIELMNKIAKILGFGQIKLNSPRMEVKRLADQLSKALNEGGKLSDIVGKKNVGKFQNTIESLKTLSSPINQPSILAQARKGIYGKKINYKKGGYELSLVKPEDIIDIEALIKKIADEKAVVWFWTADQLGRGMYSDETIEGEHYLDAGPSFALDEENRAEGVIWASGAEEKVLRDKIEESDYIFIVSGSPQQSKLFNKKVIEFLRKRTEKASGLSWNDFSKKVIDLTTKTTKAGKVNKNEITNILEKYNSFEELLNSRGNDRKKLFVEMEKQRTTTNTPLSQYLKSIGLSFDVDTLRDGFYKENGFDMNDVMLVLKPTKLGGKSKHSTYEYNVLGTVIGVPDKRVNGIDLLPEERRKKYTEVQRKSPMSGAAGSMTSTIQASKGIKRGSNLVKDTYYESGLTEDKNDYIFFHVSSAPEASIRKGIDSTKYTSLRTAREEKGLQYGVASYYTRPEDGERMVGGEKYAVRVPKGKVYPIDSDPLGYGEKAEAKVPQGTPFRAEAVKREIAEMAKKNGYEMIVGEWSYSRTGKPAGELPEFRADALVPLKPTKEKPDSFTSNAEKGMERIPFPGQQSEEAKQELGNLAAEVRDIMSAKKKFSSKEYSLADDVYMNGQVRENKYEDDEFSRDITAEEYDMMTKVLPKSMQTEVARVRSLLFGAKVQASRGIVRNIKRFSDNVSDTVDRIKSATGEDGATLNLDGSTYEDGGLVVPAGSINVAQDDVSADGLFEFLKDNEDNISSDIFKIGLYRFPDRAEVSYDLNIVIPREYRDVALKFGELAGQESLFDLDTYENIKTGSDGKNPRKFTAQELAEIAKDLSEGRLPRIVSEEAVGYRGLPGEYVEDYNGIQYFAENEKYAGVFGKNIVKANISKNKILDLAKWNKKLKDAGIPDNGMGQPFLTVDQSMFDENRNFTTKGREGTFGKMKRAIGLDEFNKFKEEFDNADVIYGEDAGNAGEMVYAVKNPKAISVGEDVKLKQQISNLNKMLDKQKAGIINYNERNLKDITATQTSTIYTKEYNELSEEIKENGVVPILIDKKTGVIIDGNHRLAILKKMGVKNIPVLELDGDFFPDTRKGDDAKMEFLSEYSDNTPLVKVEQFDSKDISVAKRGQPSMLKRTSAEVQRLMEDSMDAVDQDIADGVDAKTAVEDNITSQDWYGQLTPKQKEQFDEIIKDEFGVTPKVPAKKATGVGASIQNIVDNYYKLKDGDRSARAAINEILDADPKLKYIYDNISKINKQLQDAGVITDKTDGCP